MGALFLSALTWLVNFLRKHWQTVLIGIGVVFFLAFVILAFRAYNKRDVKLDLETVNKLNEADAREQRAIIEKVVNENAEVVLTVNERTGIAVNNVEERNKAIDEKIAEVNVKVAEAKRSGKDVTAEQLECLLIGDCK